MTTHTAKKAAGMPCWYDLTTPDVAKARAFYNAIFGWEFLISGPEFGHYSTGHIGGQLAAGMGQPPTPMSPVWACYWSTDDINKDVERAIALGASPVFPPMEIPGQGHMTLLADPTGAVFGMWQPITHLGFGVTEEAGAHVWMEATTRDMAKAAGFYAAMFGLHVDPMGTEYRVLRKGDAQVAGIWQMDDGMPKDVPPHWSPYFGVKDTDASIKTALASGGKLLFPAEDTPFGRMATLADPFGAAFKIISIQ